MPVFPTGSTVRQVQGQGRLRVGVVPDTPGFSHRNSAGRLEGVDVELAKLLAQGIFGGTPASAAECIEFVETSYAMRERILEEDVVDAVISTYGISERRRLRVDFSKPYFGTTLGVLADAATGATLQPTDLVSASICVVENTLAQEYVQRHGLGSQVTVEETEGAMVAAVREGRAQVAISSACVLEEFANDSPGAFVRPSWSLSNVPYGVGLRKGNDDLRAALDARLDDLLETGTLVQLADHGRRGRRRNRRRTAAT